MAYQKEAMVFWLCTKVLEDALGPVLLHQIPIVDYAVSDGIMYAITMTSACGKSLVAYEEVEILDTALGGEIASLRRKGRRLGGRRRGSPRRGAGSTAGGDRGGDYVGRHLVPGETHLGVPRTDIQHDGRGRCHRHGVSCDCR